MLNFIKKHWPSALAVLILLTALSGVYAKYVTDKALVGQASITAELGSITLFEHVAEKQNNGSYTLSTTTTELGNTYNTVLPGLDIPKDPYVQITDKTPIPVYVYLKIETDTLPDASMSYTLEEHWKPVEGVSQVYVYSDETGDPVQVTSADTLSVLTGNKIYVSQTLKSTSFTSAQLTFSACMKQYVSGKTAAQIYQGT